MEQTNQQNKEVLEEDNIQQNLLNHSSKMKKIRNCCIKQSLQFKQWSQKKLFDNFHDEHYDWWAFPINQKSSRGDQFQVDKDIIQNLKKDQQFICALKNNAKFVCQAWGWDLQKECQIPNKKYSQKWQHWSIRFYKLSRSLEIFQCKNEHLLTKSYANFLFENGIRMNPYGGRDIQGYFQRIDNKQIKIQKKDNSMTLNALSKIQSKKLQFFIIFLLILFLSFFFVAYLRYLTQIEM